MSQICNAVKSLSLNHESHLSKLERFRGCFNSGSEELAAVLPMVALLVGPTWLRVASAVLLCLWIGFSCGAVEAVNLLSTWDGTLRDPDAGDLKDDGIRVGGLFESKDYEVVFKAATNIVNEDAGINLEPDLVPLTEILPEDDSFEAVRDACSLLGKGAAAIFGPMSRVSSVHVSSVCDSLNVPHLETRWDHSMEAADDSINLFPHPNNLAEAYTDLMKYWQWRSVAILYEEDDDVVQMKDLLEEMSEDGIGLGYFFKNSSDSFRDVLKQIREEGIFNIFVAISDDIDIFLKQALQIGMLSDEYSYLFMSLDFHVEELQDFVYSNANMTAMRIVDVEDPVAEIFENMIDSLAGGSEAASTPASTEGSETEAKPDNHEGDDDDNLYFPRKLPTTFAMLYDAVKMFALSVDRSGGKASSFRPVWCRNDTPDDDQRSAELRDVMKKLEYDGLTGNVKLDENGFRSDFKLYIEQLGIDGLKEIGTWSTDSRLDIKEQEKTAESEKKAQEVLLRVSVVNSRPFVIVEEDDRGGVKYKGFCIDLLEELSSELNFRYELHVVPDLAYGYMHADGNWTGMIGELLEGKADLAMADLTITEARERAVDFTLPYMTTALAVVTKKSEPMKPGGIWSFFLPLTREVWVYVVLATACTIFVMYISARLSFREWTLVEDAKGEDAMQNRFNLYNCFVFVLTTLLHQRITLDPRAPATRVLAGFWYFFTFIIMAIVVSNLCESILWESEGPDYDSVQELLKVRGFTYVAVSAGSTRNFLKTSNVPLHQQLSSLVERNYRNLPTSAAIGLERVKNEDKVAFIMEQASAMFATQEDCNFTRTDPFVYHSAYGIATPRGSPHRSKLSNAILKLQETGRLQWIQQRWWNPKRFCDLDEDEDGDGEDHDDNDEEAHSRKETVEIRQLNGSDLAGAFLILYLGFIIATILAVAELFYVFSTRGKRETHLNSIAVSDHIKQAGDRKSVV